MEFISGFEISVLTCNVQRPVAILPQSRSRRGQEPLKAYDGEVTIDGIDIGPHSRRLRDRVGAVTQHAAWLPGTSARFNLDPEWRRSDGELINHLQELGVWELIESKGGLDSRLEDMALSQGQQQVLSVVRALVKQAKIVVFDEPTSRYVLESLFSLKMRFSC